MSEAAGRAEMERRLIERSLQDDVFRQQLLADPRAIIEREIETQLPENLRVVVVEESRRYHLPGASEYLAGRRRRKTRGPGTRSGDGRRCWIGEHRLPVQFILRPKLHVLIARSERRTPRQEEARPNHSAPPAAGMLPPGLQDSFSKGLSNYGTRVARRWVG